MHPGDLPDEDTEQPPAPPIAVQPHWSGLTLLVVEDHGAYRILLAWILRKLGLGFEVVEDGAAALAAMSHRHFDLVLSDCQMPVMDGYAMVREIRRRERLVHTARVPVIALTATLGPQQIRRCRAAGMDAWLVKPMTFDQVRDVLIQWLPGPQSQLYTRSSRRLWQAAHWPTRASLIETFGCEAMVHCMLTSLVSEAQADLLALEQARRVQDPQAVNQRLHRLVGGVAFLGATPLEGRAVQLINAVANEGVAANAAALSKMQRDLRRYVMYLAAL